MRYSSTKKEKKKPKGSKAFDDENAQKRQTSTSQSKQMVASLAPPQDSSNRSQSTFSGDDVDGLPNEDFDDDDVIVDDPMVGSAMSTSYESVRAEKLARDTEHRMRASSYSALSGLQQQMSAQGSFMTNQPITAAALAPYHIGIPGAPSRANFMPSTADYYMRALLRSSSGLPLSSSGLLGGSDLSHQFVAAALLQQQQHQQQSLSSSSLPDIANFISGTSMLNKSVNSLHPSNAGSSNALPQYTPLASHTATMLQGSLFDNRPPRTHRTFSVDGSHSSRTPPIKESSSRLFSASTSDSQGVSSSTSSRGRHATVANTSPKGLLTFAPKFHELNELRSASSSPSVSRSTPVAMSSTSSSREPCDQMNGLRIDDKQRNFSESATSESYDALKKLAETANSIGQASPANNPNRSTAGPLKQVCDVSCELNIYPLPEWLYHFSTALDRRMVFSIDRRISVFLKFIKSTKTIVFLKFLNFFM